MKIRKVIKVIPNSSRTESIGYMSDGTEKIRVHAEPERGKANEALISYIQEREGGRWNIISGKTSSKKILERED